MTVSSWLRFRIAADRVLAAVGLVVAAPVIAVLVILVRRHDAGPGLITVERVGRGGRTFRMWKIRTMRASADDGTAGGPPLTAEHDERVTPIGVRLRAFHLDELPQLWNVVRGEMLLLGPRPEAPAFVDMADPLWVDVLQVAPGIAGPTQLAVGAWERQCLPLGLEYYRREIVPVKLASDRWYLTAASPMLDLFVLGSLMGRFRGHAGWRLQKRVKADVEQVRIALDRGALQEPRGAHGAVTLEAPHTAAG